MIEAFSNIELAEANTMSIILDRIRFSDAWKNVDIVSTYDDDISFSERCRVPVICFVHGRVSSFEVVDFCREEGVVVRAGMFLSEQVMRSWVDNKGIDWEKFKERGGAVRVSLAHYNTAEEVLKFIDVCEGIEGW
jgi:selenocysteine lyase/cysteine desulfurase